MSSSTIATLIQGAVNSVSDALVASVPYVLGLAGAIVALFLVWRILKRFLGR